MTAGKQATSKWKAARRTFFRALHKPWLAWLLISSLVLGAVLFARSKGWFVDRLFQRPELVAYDYFVEHRMEPNSTDDLIMIVGMTEKDLKKYGYPIIDMQLAELLEKIAAHRPAVIGLDMYRDLPEPRIRQESQWKAEDEKRFAEFGERLRKIQELIVITRVGYFDPPPAFKGEDESERVAANNLEKDGNVDGVFRRGLLLMEAGTDGKAIPSFSLLLTTSYLDSKGVPWEFFPDPENPTDAGHPLLRLGKAVVPRLKPDFGGYVEIGELDYEYMVDFQKPLKFLKRDQTRDKLGQSATNAPYDYSFDEVLMGICEDGTPLPPDTFKGKIVVVATVMESIKDSNPTPIDGDFRGVHQHAMMTRQLIDVAEGRGHFLSSWPEWAKVLWIAAWALLGGSLGVLLRSPMKLIPALVLVLAALFFASQYAFGRGVWLLLATPATACVLSAAAVTSFVVLIERADRNAMATILSKHVSKRVAEYILSHREQLLDGGMIAGRALNATIVFTDLAGFSTASEKLTPEQTLRWLNDYMTVMVRLVESHDGEVNKFIGDAIMALFGAPFPSGEGEVGLAKDAEKALRCALRMREEVPKLNARWKETSPDMPPVAMRVGVFTGPIVDGSFGDTDRAEYTVIGDAVNRANRLEAAGKEIKDQLTEPEKLCTILIGPKTYALVGHLFVTAPVQNLALKGITERVTVHRVISERSQPSIREPRLT